MCTVTVFRGPERLLVTMNRDERRNRAEETPPTAVPKAGRPTWIGPADGAKGGTWFGANDRGVVACLLNAYAPEDVALLGRDDLPSRGAIIPHLLVQPPNRLQAWLEGELDPTPYPSFTLVVATPSWGRTYGWRIGSGMSSIEIADGWSMVTSSLLRADEVVAWRCGKFDDWLAAGAPEIQGVPDFNLLEDPDHPDWSPLMTRPISITRSVTQAQLLTGERWLTLRYWRREGEQPVDPGRPAAVEQLPLAPPPSTV